MGRNSMTMRTDLYQGHDYYNMDELLTEEHKLIRDTARAWVKQEVSPIIEDAAEKARAKAEAKAIQAGKPWTDADNETVLAKARVKAEKKYKAPEPVDTTPPATPAGPPAPHPRVPALCTSSPP